MKLNYRYIPCFSIILIIIIIFGIKRSVHSEAIVNKTAYINDKELLIIIYGSILDQEFTIVKQNIINMKRFARIIRINRKKFHIDEDRTEFSGISGNTTLSFDVIGNKIYFQQKDTIVDIDTRQSISRKSFENEISKFKSSFKEYDGEKLLIDNIYYLIPDFRNRKSFQFDSGHINISSNENSFEIHDDFKNFELSINYIESTVKYKLF